MDGTERRRKKSKRAIREKDYESFSDDRYEGLPINLVEQSDDEYSSDQSKYAKKFLKGGNENSLSPNSSRYSDVESEYSCESVI